MKIWYFLPLGVWTRDPRMATRMEEGGAPAHELEMPDGTDDNEIGLAVQEAMLHD